MNTTYTNSTSFSFDSENKITIWICKPLEGKSKLLKRITIVGMSKEIIFRSGGPGEEEKRQTPKNRDAPIMVSTQIQRKPMNNSCICAREIKCCPEIATRGDELSSLNLLAKLNSKVIMYFNLNLTWVIVWWLQYLVVEIT